MAKLAARTLRPEDEVSHYRIVGPLGAGGMGEVYLAQDQSLERRVALKILPPDLVRSEERVRRFMLEAKSASSLSHPNIVTIYEIGADVVRSQSEPPSDPVHFISMELVSGKTLTSLIHDDRTDLKTLLGFLAQAADGLAKAHAAGIVHRDLKPGNIMVSADGFAKVLDFGLAKLTERRDAGPEATAAPTLAADATGEGIVVGTAGYMSPEQVQGKVVDARSDIFAFGCILYEAATRRRPFLADTTIETLHKILNEKPAPVEELNPKVPSDLRRLIRRCLAKSPDQRLQSMKDLALELREIVDDYDALSASASSGGSVSGAAAAASAARRGPGALMIAIAGLVVLAAIGFGWWGLQRANQASKRQPFETMEMTTVTNRGDVADCALSPDGRYLAYLAGLPGQIGLRVHQVATGGDVEVLPASGAGIQSPAFSPDGNYVFYLARKPDAQNYRVLYQVPSLGGTPQQRAFDVDSRVTFSPDGKQIAFWRGITPKHETDLVILDLESGKERVLGVVTDREFINASPSWSPDGKQIAVALLEAVGRLRTSVAMFDVASGRRREQASLPGTQVRQLEWLKDGSGLVASGWISFSLNSQIFTIDYPGNQQARVTNDLSEYVGISVAAGNDALAAVRQTSLENIWVADLSGGPARAVTSISNPENSPFGLAVADSGTLIFSAQRDQGVQIFAVSASGGEPRALTSGGMLSVSTYAAGGRALFQRAEPGGIHVWGVNADGSGLRQLTSGAGEGVRSISPDGRFASVLHFDSLGTAWLLSAESGKEQLFASGIGGGLGFSPDSRRWMLGRNERDAAGLIREKWLAYPLAGGAPTDSVVLSGRATNPRWNPDGRGVLFQDAGDTASNLFRQDFGASAPVPVTHFTEGRILNFNPAPDAKHIAIARRIGSVENVWVTDLDGGHPVQVTQFPAGRVFEVFWMPDGRRLAIGAGSSARDAVLIRKFR